MPTYQRVAVELAKGVIEHQMPTGLINVCMYNLEGRDLQSSPLRRMYQEQGRNLNPRRLLTDEKKKIRSSTAATIVTPQPIAKSHTALAANQVMRFS